MRKTKVGVETSIIDGVLFMDGCFQSTMGTDMFFDTLGDGYTKTIRLVSLSSDWFERVYVNGLQLQTEKVDFELTLRREIRSGRGHWYAYRRVFGKLHKRYVGTDENVTEEKLVEVCRKMPTKKLGVIS